MPTVVNRALSTCFVCSHTMMSTCISQLLNHPWSPVFSLHLPPPPPHRPSPPNIGYLLALNLYRVWASACTINTIARHIGRGKRDKRYVDMDRLYTRMIVWRIITPKRQIIIISRSRNSSSHHAVWKPNKAAQLYYIIAVGLYLNNAYDYVVIQR